MTKPIKPTEIWVYDLETYPNFFLYSFINIKTAKILRFEISDRKSDFYPLKEFLGSGKIKYLVGFNNINFDYPVLHKTVLTVRRPMKLSAMFNIVEQVIATKYPAIKERDVLIPQVDLYKIWHYDNVNKATSLKWLEFAMRMENIEDLPYEPGTILDDDQKDHVTSYCDNDLFATVKFLNKSLKHIQLRKTMSKLEGLDLMNSSEIHISKQILLKKLSKAALIDPWELKKQQSPREEVKIKDILFDYVRFEDPANEEVLNQFKKEVWRFDSVEKKALTSIKFSRKYKNVVREFAEGGLHSFGRPGIYETDGDYLLVDVDFASYYPHLTFKNGLHPEHIDAVTFNHVYEGFYHERKKYPKSDPRNYVLKIVLNGTYGLSKDIFGFLYDPKWQLAICINGQLLLTMLSERVFKYCTTGAPAIIFENTDGAMYRIHRDDYADLERACNEIEHICDIPLEIQVCKKIIARDVNNYINIIDDDNIKFKGAFEIDRDFHKNHSKRIVPLALANYYIHGIDPADTIKNHIYRGDYSFADNHGIFDFCLGAKMKGKNKLYSRIYTKEGVQEEKLSKITRYYVSNDGVELIKKLPPLKKNMMTHTDKHREKVDAAQMNMFDLVDDVKVDASDRETNLEVGFKCEVLNVYDDTRPLSDYDINYQYYIRECEKTINKCGQI
jgi:hypothetical protein